jgi:hypothetical protein
MASGPPGTPGLRYAGHEKTPGKETTEMREVTDSLVIAIILIIWIGGIVIAKGFWSTSVAVLFPPWAIYLFVERVFQMYGLV